MREVQYSTEHRWDIQSQKNARKHYEFFDCISKNRLKESVATRTTGNRCSSMDCPGSRLCQRDARPIKTFYCIVDFILQAHHFVKPTWRPVWPPEPHETYKSFYRIYRWFIVYIYFCYGQCWLDYWNMELSVTGLSAGMSIRGNMHAIKIWHWQFAQ